jgi:hypothetical protein
VFLVACHKFGHDMFFPTLALNRAFSARSGGGDS